MNLRDLRYMLALAEHRHFGRAAEACRVSQPTLSVQLKKLEDSLGAALFERSSKQVVPTPVCEALLPHARIALAEIESMAALARAMADPLHGTLRIGVIPTLGPYLLPLVFAPLRAALPDLAVEPWEDVTATLIEKLRAHELDAALLATEPDTADLSSRALFTEPFIAALPPDHPLAARDRIAESDLAADVLVLADGHCLRDQALAACGLAGPLGGALRASSLATLINMVAAGYGTTLVPGLAAGAAQDAGIALRPLAARASRTIRIAWRSAFPRRAAIEAVAQVIAERLAPYAAAAEREAAGLDRGAARGHVVRQR
ncbi:LysR substrate-binding domain-containing protein [Roseomonas rosulenta]|uniref:LysR substrate-binding domain-containing protein n=1 Tax=Roseomonas rosulenta TaxID=2748667 RepID=UPI0018DFC1C5|nr:LysR substrate-binding domain-containing protein [Roseomonas rosulenta]